MERFFLHIRSHDGFTIDEEGTLHDNLSAVRSYAIAGARDMIAGDVRDGVVDLDQSIIISDKAGQQLDEIAFSSVLSFRRVSVTEVREVWSLGPQRTMSLDNPQVRAAAKEVEPGLADSGILH